MKVKETEMVMAVDQVPIPELYQQCLHNENEWTKLDLEELKISLLESHLFGQRLFSPAPTFEASRGSSSREKERDLRISMRLYQGNKYQDILGLLKNAPDSRSILFAIAWWLVQEKVCKAEQIVGREELRRQANKMFHRLSVTDFHHADRVRAWIPYFGRLLRDLRAAKANSRLLREGYNQTAIQAAHKKRSPTAAACDWLADNRPSLNVSSATLANAYSRVYGPKHYLSRRSGRP